MNIAFGLLLLLLQAMQAQEPLTLAQQAHAAYLNGDYAAAQMRYEMLISEGIRDSAVYLNLGSTYFQLHDMGRALLNYRRAQVLAPRDPLLNSNLAHLRSTRVDVQGDETAFVDSLAALTLSSLTVSELQWLVLGSWCLFFAILVAAIIRIHWRDLLRGPLIVLGVLVFVGLLLWWSRDYTAQYRPPAVVLAERAQVMSGPGEDYLPLYELHAAAEVRLLGRRDGWVRFVLPDQQQGWLPAEVIEIV